MKNKGFTLVELLSVIAILAILAILAIPKIQEVINTTKVGNVQNSCLGYIKAFEDKMIGDQLDGPISRDGIYYVENIDMNNKAKGELPTDGWLNVVNGDVKEAELKFGKYVLDYDGRKCIVNKNKKNVSQYGE